MLFLFIYYFILAGMAFLGLIGILTGNLTVPQDHRGNHVPDMEITGEGGATGGIIIICFCLFMAVAPFYKEILMRIRGEKIEGSHTRKK